MSTVLDLLETHKELYSILQDPAYSWIKTSYKLESEDGVMVSHDPISNYYETVKTVQEKKEILAVARRLSAVIAIFIVIIGMFVLPIMSKLTGTGYIPVYFGALMGLFASVGITGLVAHTTYSLKRMPELYAESIWASKEFPYELMTLARATTGTFDLEDTGSCLRTDLTTYAVGVMPVALPQIIGKKITELVGEIRETSKVKLSNVDLQCKKREVRALHRVAEKFSIPLDRLEVFYTSVND